MDTKLKLQVACVGMHMAETGDSSSEGFEAVRNKALDELCEAVVAYMKRRWDYAHGIKNLTASEVKNIVFEMGAEHLPTYCDYDTFAWGMYIGRLVDEVFRQVVTNKG